MVRYVLWNALRRTCTFIGALVLFSALISAVFTGFLLKSVPQKKDLPEEMVLFWRADSGLSEGTVNPSFGDPYSFLRQGGGFLDTVNALHKATDDPRVKGLVVMLSGAGMNMAHLYELREAVTGFREAGKFAYITAYSYGETGRGMGTYYLASAFDEIWLHPVGTLSLGGIYLETPYGRSALDKIGIGAQFYQREEYKGIFEGAERMEMSAAGREMNEIMVGSLADFFVTGILSGRNMERAELVRHIGKGVMTDQEAREAGLVDHLDYFENLERAIKEKVKGDPDFSGSLLVGLRDYGRRVSPEKPAPVVTSVKNSQDKSGVALVYINGAIMETAPVSSAVADSYAFWGGENLLSARHISSVLQDIADDESIDSVVLRINSPGGTPVAAEIIHHAITVVRAKGKKVVVSMGEMAASAGYWIAAPADMIFTTPATLTGSIGVAGGKFNARELWDKAGINWETVQWGENAGMMSLNRPFSESQAARMNVLMDSTYQRFLDRVAQGRGMSGEEARSVAKGRVWTGQQAIDKGLADEVGGLTAALDYAARLAGEKSRMDVKVSVFPKPKKPIEQIMEILEQQVYMGRMAEIQAGFISLVQPVAKGLGVWAAAPDGRLAYEFRVVH